MRATTIIFALSVGLSLTAAGSVVAPAALLDDSSGGIVEREQIQVGDTIARGELSESGCRLPAFGIRAEILPGDGVEKWTAVRVEPDCSVVVTGKWDGDLSDGPQDLRVIDAISIREILGGGKSDPVDEGTAPEGTSNSTKSDGYVPESGGGVSIQACETSYQHVFNYGYGGTWDSLTHKNGQLDFCYTGTTVSMTSQWGNCEGSSPAWWYDWVVDGCWLDSYSTASYEVWRTGKGSYHCSPPGTSPCSISSPDGYYHSLFENEDGHPDGVSHCTYWSSGQTTAGVSNEILQGCS